MIIKARLKCKQMHVYSNEETTYNVNRINNVNT